MFWMGTFTSASRLVPAALPSPGTFSLPASPFSRGLTSVSRASLSSSSLDSSSSSRVQCLQRGPSRLGSKLRPHRWQLSSARPLGVLPSLLCSLPCSLPFSWAPRSRAPGGEAPVTPRRGVDRRPLLTSGRSESESEDASATAAAFGPSESTSAAASSSSGLQGLRWCILSPRSVAKLRRQLLQLVPEPFRVLILACSALAALLTAEEGAAALRPRVDWALRPPCVGLPLTPAFATLPFFFLSMAKQRALAPAVGSGGLSR
uniref:Uncharacterized protein n=1 Tax=Ixodes ricinus TaxID=34613 RepID=A0A6B0V7T2_IXORI